MKIEQILDSTKAFEPVVFTEANEEYPDLKEGDCVIDYNDDLALVYEDGEYQISYKDWVGTYEDPIPVLLVILSGNVEAVWLPQYNRSILLIKDEAGEYIPDEDEDDDFVEEYAQE